ncbi:F-box protein At5g39250 [Selaginella moellendorffii]|nr:F-box protein At5g39250 [Selaginella moellendorffii]|eukprot:XP_002966587.2 F-box protein At5g39250 [Selaginella moellendorffii]
MDEEGQMGEVLKEVFPLLTGRDLAACICVCRQWRDVGRDDFLWRRLCASRWPSICLNSSNSHQRSTIGSSTIGAIRGYRNLFSTIARSKRNRALPAPKLCFRDLEFYVDVWVGRKSVYSAIVAGPVVQSRIKDPPEGICDSMRQHLLSSEYKMSVPVLPYFQFSPSSDVSDSDDGVCSMSMLVRRKDSDQIATIIDGSRFTYVDGLEKRAHAYDYLHISPLYPFLSEIRAWVALLLVERPPNTMAEVFGIELDFLDTASSDDEVLLLLDILDWK